MKSESLVEIPGISKGYVSDILHHKNGLSREVIRKLAAWFKVSQEALNRPYKPVVAAHAHMRDAGVMNTRKSLEIA